LKEVENLDIPEVMMGKELKEYCACADQNKIIDENCYSCSIENDNKIRVYKLEHGLGIECNQEFLTQIKRVLPTSFSLKIKQLKNEWFAVLFLEDGKEYVPPLFSAEAYNIDGNVIITWRKGDIFD
jgi:hypothetical protein